MKYRIRYEIRGLGATGNYPSILTDVVDANDPREANKVFREKHEAKFEFGNRLSLEPLQEEIAA